MNKKISAIIISFFFVLSFISSILAAPDLNTVVSGMEKSYLKQLSGIQDFTIVQETEAGFLSMKITTYYKKAKVNNELVLLSRMETDVMGFDTVMIYDGIYNWSRNSISGEIEKEIGSPSSPFQLFTLLTPEKSILLGEEQLSGVETYKIQLNDNLWDMGMEGAAQPDTSREEKSEVHGFYWIDKNDFVPLKSQSFIKISSVENGNTITTDIITEAELSDYRLVGTMQVAHQIKVTNQMKIDDPSLSKEEQEEQLAFMRTMGGMGNMEIKVTRTEVNTGLPDSLFDGNLLEPGKPLFGGSQEYLDESPVESKPGEGSMEDFFKGLQGMMDGFEGLEDIFKSINIEN